MTTAPMSTIVAESSGCAVCCSMTSTFSTSRTTFVCTIAEFARVWKPIESAWSRAARALRRSAPTCRTAPMKQRVYITWLG